MAIEHVTKMLVAVHDSSRDRFFQRLQRLGVMHVTRAETAAEAGRAGGRELDRIDAAIEFLATRADKKAKAKPVLSRKEFELAAAQTAHAAALDRLDRVNRELAETETRLRQLTAEQQRLRPWRGLDCAVSEVQGRRAVLTTFVRFPDRSEFDRAREALAGLPAAVQAVGADDAAVCAILAQANDTTTAVAEALTAVRHEAVDLRGITGRPADALAALGQEERVLAARQVALRQEIAALSGELPGLKVSADAVAREAEREAAVAAVPKTASVHLVHGWVRRRDRAKLARLVGEIDAAVMVEVEPATGEEPPVALVNRPVFRPFEMVLELFSLPSPKELDPTWLVAPFFGAFFALCLTDAGYGIVVAVLTYFLMRRLGMSNKLLGIILIGAILTVPAGALVGGWFGDIPDRLGVPAVKALKDRMMWFDPVNDPMKFFILSIALGYVQMVAGIAFEIADCLRARNWGDGLLGQLPWFLFLNGLTAKAVFARQLGPLGGAAMILLVLASVAAIIVFTQRTRETLLAQWLWFGLLTGFFVFYGTKFGWLPRAALHSYWVALACFAALLALGGVSVFRSGRLKVPVVAAGGLTVASLVLYFLHLLPWVVPALLGVVFVAMSPAGKGLPAKLLWGGYALYGATGYIGVVLSYIRLMALGMCTGGVAVAINVIAWMLLKMPVVGIPLALLVLIGGHTYNIAVNVLGAFVHSLRLQYVEFFPRFYAGGGERFEPFGEKFSYVAVKN